MSNGFIIVPRETLEDLAQLGVSYCGVFLHLVGRAAWRDTLTCKRGTLFDSMEGLADKLKISRQSTRTFIKNLEHYGLISVKSTNRRHDICIVNYERFGLSEEKSTNDQPTTNQPSTNDQPGKKKLRSKNIYIPPIVPQMGEFERIWARYPKKRGMKAALKHFGVSVKTPEQVKAIHGALDMYLAELRANGTSLQYTQNGSTWFNDWQSWVRVDKPVIAPPREKEPAWKSVPAETELVSQADLAQLLAGLGKGLGKGLQNQA